MKTLKLGSMRPLTLESVTLLPLNVRGADMKRGVTGVFCVLMSLHARQGGGSNTVIESVKANGPAAVAVLPTAVMTLSETTGIGSRSTVCSMSTAP